MRIYINPSANYYKPIKYTLDIVSDFCADSLEIIASKEGSSLIIDHSDSNSIGICTEFYDKLKVGNLSHKSILKGETLIKDQSGKADFLTTIFYLVNCLQEYNADATQKDQFGRFL